MKLPSEMLQNLPGPGHLFEGENKVEPNEKQNKNLRDFSYSK